MHLYPNFGEPITLGGERPLAFVFIARPGSGPSAEATVELVRGTETVRRAGVPLPRPDPSGQLRVVSGLSLTGVAPGEYTLRLVLSDGRSMVTRTSDVTLGP